MGINDRHVENRTNGLLRRKILPFVGVGTSEIDTGWDLPLKAIVLDAIIDLTTNVAGATMDVGILSSEAGGDADCFIDGEDCATATGILEHNTVDAASANITLGVYLYEAVVLDATAVTPLYHVWNTFYPTDANAGKSVSYKISDHAIAGNINILYIDMA